MNKRLRLTRALWLPSVAQMLCTSQSPGRLMKLVRTDVPPIDRKANKDNIGNCLQEWGLGSSFGKDDNGNCKTIFAQNIRLMKNPKEFTAWMPDDNFEITRKNIVIDDSLFDPNVCTFTKSGIYWSLKSSDEDLIILHGCRGEEYKFVRPEKNAENILEWFEYRDYK
jgi:hypothetical protein